MKPRVTCAALAVLVLAAGLAGCGKEDTEMPTDAVGITDAAGRTVAIPASVKRVVSPFTMFTRVIVALGGQDKLVGISHSCILPEEETAHGKKLLDLPDVGPFGRNTELIASLRPDIVFCRAEDVQAMEEKTGATVVCVSFPRDGKMEDMFYGQIDLIGSCLHLRAEAESLKAFIRSTLAPVSSVVDSVPDTEKPRVYFGWTSWTGDIINTVTRFDPIRLAGGINVAHDCEGFAKGERGILVSREHIIKWNPDVIFLSRYRSDRHVGSGRNIGSTPVTVGDVMDDPLLQSVTAVKEKRVYYTTAFCNWWPHQRALAQVLYMAKLFYPDRFADLDVEREGNAIFKRFYGSDGLYSELADALELRGER